MSLQSLLELDKNLLIKAQNIVSPENAHLLVLSGELVVIWVALLLVCLWLYGVYKKENSYKISALQIFGLIVAVFLIYSLINFGIPQWRPHPSLLLQGSGIHPLIPHPTDNSFPSGHALFFAAALSWVYLYTKNFWLILITFILGLITVSSRVLGGVHYPGDILGGLFFGLLGAFLFHRIVEKIIAKISPKILHFFSVIKL